MKKDTQNKAGVSSKSNARTAPIGDARPSTASTTPVSASAAQASPCTISARYIDSRLKQFCLR